VHILAVEVKKYEGEDSLVVQVNISLQLGFKKKNFLTWDKSQRFLLSSMPHKTINVNKSRVVSTYSEFDKNCPVTSEPFSNKQPT